MKFIITSIKDHKSIIFTAFFIFVNAGWVVSALCTAALIVRNYRLYKYTNSSNNTVWICQAPAEQQQQDQKQSLLPKKAYNNARPPPSYGSQHGFSNTDYSIAYFPGPEDNEFHKDAFEYNGPPPTAPPAPGEGSLSTSMFRQLPKAKSDI
eukprot:GEZU01012439.1.p1 GENE.GEZU01012439.1~~GEZU01012439.1.p1  ORF type:complete len:151 (+),score=19.38 GEZU01012439.1:440-892(+)